MRVFMRRHHIALFLGLWAPLAGCDNADFGSSGGLSGASKTKKGTATDVKTNGDDDDDSQKTTTDTSTNTRCS